MSDGSSLLLNMGAEVNTSTGLNSTLASQNLPATSENGEFAAVLQSALVGKGEASGEAPLITSEMDSSALLFNQQEDAAGSLLQQQDLMRQLLPEGKDLPPGEQNLAWQTVLAEYDSTDPATPHMLMASGDDEEFSVEELTSEDILALHGSDEKALPQQEGMGSQQLKQNEQLLPEQLRPTVEASEQFAPVMLTAEQQGNGRIEPVLGQINENDAITGLNSVRPNSSNQSSLSGQFQAQEAQSIEANALDQVEGMSKTFDMELSSQGGAKDAQVKQDIGTLADSLAGRVTQSVSNGANNHAVQGASAYSAISALNNPTAMSPATHAPVVANMTITPENPAWGDIIGDRVQWMTTQNIQEAKIRLNPPELGMLEVRVQVGQDQQTTISFSSPHSQVRDALESAVPRLREMFGESGLNLGNVDVSHHSMSGQSQAGRGEDDSGNNSGNNMSGNYSDTDDTGAQQGVSALSDKGMLDLYA